MVKMQVRSDFPSVTVVVVAFNSASLIGKCLASIPSELPIILVDNGSADGTIREVRKVRPDAKIIENGLNVGYGIANNVGLAQVDTEYGMILNPDAFVADHCIERLVAALDRNPQAACAAPVLKTVDDKLDVYWMGPNETRHTRCEIQPEGDICTWFLMGAAVVWRMSAWKQVGGFDRNFFLYNEDVDLCLRTQSAGYAHIFSPEAEVIHLGGRSTDRTLRQSWLRDWHMTWSNLYYRKKIGERRIMTYAMKITLWHGFRALIYIVFFRPNKVTGECAKFSAAFQFLIGRGAHTAKALSFIESRPEAGRKVCTSITQRKI